MEAWIRRYRVEGGEGDVEDEEELDDEE
jgi:hypothetical protein